MTARQVLAVCVGGATIMTALATAYVAGLRINATPSMPSGVWTIVSARTVPKRGDIVAVCLPHGAALRQARNRGYIAAGPCPDAAEPLVKPVGAVSGDVVTVSANGISVNTTPVTNTAALARDEAGRVLRPVPAGSYRVAPDDVWLLSGHDPRSFDSRYFGAVPIADVIGVARPLWVTR